MSLVKMNVRRAQSLRKDIKYISSQSIDYERGIHEDTTELFGAVDVGIT